MSEHLIAFRDGSYKKLTPVTWKHSQWIHFTLADGSVVSVNPANVNYMQRSADTGKYEKPIRHGEEAEAYQEALDRAQRETDMKGGD